MKVKKIFSIAAAFLFLFLTPGVVSANHSWGGYHWARTSNPFTLKLGDNLSSNWDSVLATTSADWSLSDVLDTTVVTGQGGKNCKSASGGVQVCNRKYGNNGWLGIAQVWVNGLHITRGVTKMNDTYFNTPTYNTTAWRNLVMCQEVGHTLGLDHQDENFDNPNLGTCMDYTSDPSTNQHPNQHDYDELELIYSHLDGFTTVGQIIGQIVKQGVMENLDNPSEWGRQIKGNSRVAVYERDFGFGNKVFTFVIWAN